MNDVSSLPYWLTLHKLFLKSLFLNVVKNQFEVTALWQWNTGTRTNQSKGNLASAVGQESPL